MGQYANFYNSKNSDRTYDADSFSEILKPLFKDGVINGQMQVKTYSNMMVKVESGNCYIGGKHKYFEHSTNLTIESANPTLDRIDNIVVRRNDTERDFILMVVKGSESRTPQAPTPVRGGGIYDLVLAQVYVNKATIRIEQSHITDTRMISQLCGWVAGAVEQIAFEQITAQFLDFYNNFKNLKTEEFNTWFNQLQRTLDSNAISNLSNQLTQLSSVVNGRLPKTITSKSISSSSFSSVLKQSWDIEGEYKFRAWVAHPGMTNKDVFLQGTTIVSNTSVGVFESATNGFYVYASEKPSNTVVISQAVYLKGD